MKDQIIIHLNNGTYECEFIGPHSEEVLALFGTRTIPTLYSEADECANGSERHLSAKQWDTGGPL